MTRWQYALQLAMVFFGSTVGGIVGTWWLVAPVSVAQKANGVNAEEFLLVDHGGKARAGLGLDQNGEVGLVMTSRDGNRKLTLSPDEPAAFKLTDRSGRVIWSAP